MKKLYFLIVLFVLASLAIQGQNVVFSESFDNGGVPEGWILLDADGDGYNWFSNDDPYFSAVLADNFLPYSGDGYMLSSSYVDNNSLDPDNWLISPAITISVDAELSYYVRTLEVSYPDHYGVFISTTGTSPSDFVWLFDETASSEWISRTLDLSAYAGQTVYIAFRHYNSYDKWYLAIDEVNVTGASYCELVVEYGYQGNDYLQNVSPDWLTVSSSYGSFSIGQESVYGWSSYTDLLFVTSGDPLTFTWNDPDQEQHATWCRVYDPSEQKMVFWVDPYSNMGDGGTDSYSLTYTPSCGASCTEDDRCELHLHLERTQGEQSGYDTYGVEMFIDHFNVGSIMLPDGYNVIDTFIKICPERRVEIWPNVPYDANNLVFTVTDAFGNVTNLVEWNENYLGNDMYGYMSSNVCTEQCELTLNYGTNSSFTSTMESGILQVYAGDDPYPIFEVWHSSEWYSYESYTESIHVPANVPLRIVWHDPDPTNHSMWFNINDNIDQHYVCGKQEGEFLADGQIATYTTTCGSYCAPENQCPVAVSITRADGTVGGDYVLNVMGGGLNYGENGYGELRLPADRNQLDTVLMFCPERYIEISAAAPWETRSDIVCTVTDADGNVTELNNNDNYVYNSSYTSYDACATSCVLYLSLGIDTAIEPDMWTPCLYVYAGNEQVAYQVFTQDQLGVFNDNYYVINATAGVPLRFMWQEPDRMGHASHFSIFDPMTEQVVFEKVAGETLNDGEFLTYLPTCSRGCAEEEQCPMSISLNRETANEDFLLRIYGGGLENESMTLYMPTGVTNLDTTLMLCSGRNVSLHVEQGSDVQCWITDAHGNSRSIWLYQYSYETLGDPCAAHCELSLIMGASEQLSNIANPKWLTVYSGEEELSSTYMSSWNYPGSYSFWNFPIEASNTPLRFVWTEPDPVNHSSYFTLTDQKTGRVLLQKNANEVLPDGVVLEYIPTCSVEAIVTEEVTNVDFTSASANFIVNTIGIDNYVSGNTLICGVCWSTSPNPVVVEGGLYSAYNISGVDNGMSVYNGDVEMSNLTPNTTYYVRSFVVYDGETIYGNELTFTTLSCTSTQEVYKTVCSHYDVSAGNEEVILSESFDNGVLPDGWSTIDNDGDGYAWDAGQSYNSGSWTNHTGAGCVSSASYRSDVGALSPDNWLITPALNIPTEGVTTFSWWATAQDPSYPSEHYVMYVSAGSNTISDFLSNPVYEETLTTGRDYQQHSIDLSAYAGQSVYVAFRHNDCYDMFWLNIDDVTLENSAPLYSFTESGTYTYATPNQYGCMDTTILHLTVLNNLPSVITYEVANIGLHSANGWGEVISDCDQQITECGLCYSTHHNPTIDDLKAMITNPSDYYFYLTLSGLETGTTYYVRAYAINSTGVSYGEEMEFATLNSAEVSGTVTDVTTGNAIPGAYVSLFYEDNNNPGFVTTVVADTYGNFSLADLVEGNYSFIANASGYESANMTMPLVSGIANNISLSLSPAPCQTPINVDYELHTGDSVASVSLAWEMPSDTMSHAQGKELQTSVGAGSTYTMGAFHVFSPEQLIPYNGGVISSVGAYFNGLYEYTTYTLQIWTGSSLYAPDSQTPAYEQVVNSNEVIMDAWNDITLNTPFAIDGTQYLFVGFLVECNGPTGTSIYSVAATDYGNMNVYYGNTTYWNGSWHALSNIGVPNYNWMIRATVIPNGLTYNVYENGTAIANNVEGSSYVVSSYNPQQEQICYQVAANCVNGQTSELSVCATVLQTLPTVVTNEVSNIRYNSAMVRGEVTNNGNGEITQFGFCYSTIPHPTLTTAYYHYDTGNVDGEFSLNISYQMLPQTTYYVRAFATNSLGTAYGNELVFTTLEECHEPINLTVSDVLSSSAFISWQNNEANGGTPESYELQYKLADATEWTTISNITDEYYMLIGLTQQSSYKVRVRAVCETYRESAMTEEVGFTTLCVSGADQVTIGEGSDAYYGDYLPVTGYNVYSYTQQIYDASEIGAARTIDHIAVQYFYETSYTLNVDIYLGHTNKSSFMNSSDWVPYSDLTLVYSGNISIDNTGENYWFDIPLTNAFEYNGIDNLVLVFDNNSPVSLSGHAFYTHYISENKSLWAYNSEDINPANVSAYIDRLSFRNNLKIPGICITEGCDRANVVVREVTDSSVTLLCAASNNNDYELQYAEEGSGDYTTIGNSTSGVPYILNGLNQNTRYVLRIRSICGPNEYSGWKIVTFNTPVKHMDRLYVNIQGVSNGNGSSWTNATTDLLWALNTAKLIHDSYAISPEVWVAEGTYYGNTSAYNAFSISGGIKLYGGFDGTENSLDERNITAHPTVLDGQNARRVLRQTSAGHSDNNYNYYPDTLIIDGFTIRNGYANDGDGNNGGGAYLLFNFWVNNCNFENNRCNDRGGAVYVEGGRDGDIAYGFDNCVFTGNQAHETGGAVCDDGQYADYYHCEFRSNTSENYAGGVRGGRAFVNCAIVGNHANQASGGIQNVSQLLLNCDIVGNTVNNSSDGIGLREFGGALVNCVIWGNKALNSDWNSNISVDYNMHIYNSAVEGGCADNYGHIAISLASDNEGTESGLSYPAFADLNSGNYRLRGNSSLIDAGINDFSEILQTYGLTGLAIDNTDLSGLDRVYGDAIDIGCYENHNEQYCSSPYGIAATDITGGSAMITWQNGNIDVPLYYELSYKTEEATVWTDISEQIRSDYYMLSDLLQQTTYVVRLRAICDTDNVSPYAEASFSTSCLYGSQPTLIAQLTDPSSNNGNVLPVQTFYNYSYTQQIYLSEEMGGVNAIDTIYMQYFYTTPITRNIDIYLGHTNKSEFANSSDWIPVTDLTLVYSGNITFDNSGENYWFAMPLSTSFQYNGSDNLVVAFDDNTGSWQYSNNKFYTHNASANRSLYVYSDGINYNPAGLVSGNLTNNRNNIWIPGECYTEGCGISNVSVREVTYNSALIYFAANSDATEMQLEYREAGDEDYTVLPTENSPYSLTGLRQNTVYEVRIRSLCDTTSSPWLTRTFLTDVQNMDRLYVTTTGTGNGSSWDDAIGSIAVALNAAARIKEDFGTMPEIWVAQGTYYGDSISNSAFTMVEGVNVYGGFEGIEPADFDLSLRDFDSHATILDGQRSQRVLNQAENFVTPTVWDGFTLQNGYRPDNSASINYGGGAYLRQLSTLSHCRIINNIAYNGGGVYVNASYYNIAVLDHCEIDHNSAYYNGCGVYSDYAQIRYCSITHNYSNTSNYYSYGGGVYVSSADDYSGRHTISNCLIANNTSKYYGGVFIGSSNVYIDNTTIVNNSAINSTSNGGYGGVYNNSYTSYLNNCIIWGNKAAGVSSNLMGDFNCRYCAVEDIVNGSDNILLASENNQSGNLYCPRFVNPSVMAGADDETEDVDWHLAEGSVCVNRGSNDLVLVADSLDFNGNARIQVQTVDMGCYESVYDAITLPEYNVIVYVTETGAGSMDGTSWNNALASLTDALSIAYMNDADIWVAEGTYYGDSVSATAFTMVEGVNVYGGFAGTESSLEEREYSAHPTILDGQHNQRLLCQNGDFGTYTVWDGFTLQNGYAQYESNVGYGYNGGGAYLRHGSILRNCLITQNNTSSFSGAGGGVYVAGDYYNYDTTFIINCKFSHNTSYSSGGGAFFNSRTMVKNAVFEYNTSSYSSGGGVCVSGRYNLLSNCLIANNTSNGNGAGVFFNSLENIINNSTIVNNLLNSSYLGAGIYSNYNNTITNSIVWGNKKNGEPDGIQGSYNASYVASDNIYSGEHNIILSLDNNGTDIFAPRFVNPSATAGSADVTDNADWHLQQGSPCVNRGDNSVADAYDLDGNTRVQQDTADLGCYESPYNSVALPTYNGIVYVKEGGAGAMDGTSWDNAIASVKTAVNLAAMNNAMVWVAAGIYHGDGISENAFVMLPGVNVYGGFAGTEEADYDLSLRDFDENTTILDGQYVQRVLFQPESFSENTAATWDGFTIQNGRVAGNGVGVYLRGYGTISHCRIMNNTIASSGYYDSRYGAGVYAYGYNTSNKAKVIHCVIQYNGFENCYYSYGGGLYACYADISHTEISYNNAVNCGGGVFSNYYSNFSNCLIYGNTVTYSGGGVYVNSNNNSFVNCDIVNNTVNNNGDGGGIFNTSYNNQFTNSIIWGNKKGYTVNNIYGSVGISYCAVEEGYDGLGNISLASTNDGIDGSQYYVRFIDPANNDYQLHPTSSCIDLGNNEVVTDSVDFYGNIRVYGGMVDIGCSEIQEESNCPSVINPQVSNITTNNAQLNWHPVGSESQWVVVYGEVNGNSNSMTVTDTICSLTGLSLNRNYTARVRAICEEGAMSIFSLPVNFQTNCDPDMLDALGEFTSFSPINGNIIDANGVTFTWNNVTNATSYDFYLWQSTGTMPSVPTRSGIIQPMVTNYSLPDYAPGRTYYWKVVAWNECISDTSEQLSVQVNPYPDLHVTGITHGDARVGQSMTIAWTVKNDGEGRTPNGETWTEYVWLAQDCDVRYYDSHDRLLATVENQQQLLAGESYTTSEMTVTIPNDIDPGSYYLFVFADQPDAYNINFGPTGGVAPNPYQPSVTGDPYPYLTGYVHHEGVIRETVEHDNFFYVVLNVMPPPSPDLVVSAVTHGGNAISGTSTNVTWTVENRGEAAAMGSWIDIVYLSADTVLDTSTDLVLGRYVHENGLALNDSYQRTEEVTIPVEYNGDYYFIVYTDNTNMIYEGLLENNNKNISQPMHVTLTWMTDLQVSSVNVSANNTVDANGQYNCEFTVINEGSSPTYVNRWTDAIYISEEPVFDRPSAIRLASVNHNEVLNSLESYTVSQTIRIPGDISGQWYLFVETDVNNDVFEYNADDNNVYNYLPALDVVNPDLEVTTIVLSDVLNPNEQQMVQWIVRNNGPGNMVNRSFTDCFYFNGSQVYNANVSNVTIHAGDSIVRTAIIQLPCSNANATADMLTISTDVTNSVLETSETNNEKSVYLTVSTPDLTVNSIITTEEPGTTNVSLWSGTTAVLWYNVANNGDVSAISSNITDKVYFNTSADSYQESDLICTNIHAMNIGAGENETFSCTVTIPNGISGTYYYHVVTNAAAELCEGSAIGNNAQTSTAVEVQLSPSPDLVMSSLVAPASVYLGANFVLTYTILNQGNAALSHTTVSQRFYYSMSPTAYDSRNVLTTTNDYLNLAVNESVTNSVTVNLPVDGISGVYYIHAVTDYGDQVYEYEGEDNNTAVSNNIMTSAYQLDLQLTQVDGPAEMQWGQTAIYTLHIQNNSSLPTLANSWYDVVYLSADEVLHSSDRLMQQVNHNTVLDANGNYTVEIQVTIPYGTPSTAYLIAITDYTSQNVDINPGNNVLVKTLSVNSVPTPDLAVSETGILDPVVAGQSARIAYTVTNVGEVPVEHQTWNDKVFVSYNNSYESIDQQLLTRDRQNITLAQNDSYRDTLNFTVPMTYSGDLFLLMIANANNDPYELNRANNMESVAVNVTVPLPGDLIVTDVVCQSSIVSGNVLHAVWTIKNIGDNPIVGNGLRSLVYVSADTVFDANDRLLGRVSSDNINLGIDATMQQSMDARLTGVAAGDYYLIIKTDVTNAFNEVNDDNNMGRTIDPFAVTIRPLPFNTDVFDTLINDEVSDYMLMVGEQVSQTVRIHVTSEDSLLGAVNMIYATYNGMGSNLNYSYSTIGQYQANSELYIPSTQQGYYGVNIYGTTPTNQPQNTIVRADILPFELRDVNDNHGGNTGVVTLELTGSRFRPDMTVCMRNGNEVICADTLIYVNYYQVFVQFDLTGRTPGVYDMSAVNLCEGEAVLANAFTIEEGQPSGLSYNLLFPSSPRPNRNIVMMLEYGNTGNVDLRNQVLEIISNGGSPIALTPEGLNLRQTVIQVPLSIEGEPEGLLRPGSYGTLNIYCYSSGALIFTIKPVEE